MIGGWCQEAYHCQEKISGRI
jgi:hypothetical protein